MEALNPDLKHRLMVLKSGEITEPFTLDGRNYNLARLMRVHSTQLTPQLEARMREELFVEWTMRQLAMGNLTLEPLGARVGQGEAKTRSWL